MGLHYVKIHHPELGATAEVKPSSVQVWEDMGWQLVEDEPTVESNSEAQIVEVPPQPLRRANPLPAPAPVEGEPKP